METPHSNKVERTDAEQVGKLFEDLTSHFVSYLQSLEKRIAKLEDAAEERTISP